MWELLLAPSVCGRKGVRFLAALDRLLGSPGRRLLNRVTRRIGSGLSEIHEVGLDAPEEDYLALLPAGGCFLLALAFPASASLWQLGRFHELPEKRKLVLLDFYHRCLQKHLYVTGRQRRILSKNAAFASWVTSLRGRYPEARFLLCVREPASALSSQLSSVSGALPLFGTHVSRELLRSRFEETCTCAYHALRAGLQTAPEISFAVIDQERLRKHPGEVFRSSLERIGIPIPAHLEQILEETETRQSGYQSNHRHSPGEWNLDGAKFGSCVGPVYEEILQYAPTK
jgi:hypothetical protein